MKLIQCHKCGDPKAAARLPRDGGQGRQLADVARVVLGAGHGLWRGDPSPLALADQQRGVGERAELAGVVGVKMADADLLDLLGLDLQLPELLDERDPRRARIRPRQVAGVPDHHVVAGADRVAAERERHVRVAVREDVAEAALVVGAAAAIRLRSVAAAQSDDNRECGW